MITNLFLNVIAISISTSLIIIFLLIFAPFLNKRYAVKWKYLIWVVIAVRLIIPFHMNVPFPQIVIDVPTEITVPIETSNENDAPAMPPIEPKPIESNNGNANKAPLQTEQRPLQTEQRPLKLTLLDITAYLWLTGCLLFLSVHIFSFLHYKGRIAKKGMAVNEKNILQQVRESSRKLRIKPNIRILRYEDAESPMVIGFLKPTLVLPNCDYSEEELFFVLKHELIHIKRHDIYFKLLFVIANALHWFNPLIYIMQKEAVVDMELSCDEEVIRQTAYAVRKAYTETLLSTFNKQRKKGTFLTTQFYGGKKIMKKRFKNILTKSPKKNGLLLCICAVCITLISGMLIGCSVISNDSPDDSDTDISNDAQNENTEDPSEQSLGSEEKSYKSVLLGESNFRHRDGLVDKSLNISEIRRAVVADDDDDDFVTRVLKFAVVDLDGDKEEEVVLWIRLNDDLDWGFEILHYLDGEIYGYPIWYRAFMNLKTDGTFSTSYSAADQGMGRMTFSENGYSVSEAYTHTTPLGDGEYTVEYFVDNEPCSMDDYFDVVEGQDQKADVEWYDFSEDNINALLK